MPLSTVSSVPVMVALSASQRNATACAISSVEDSRPAGYLSRRFAVCYGVWLAQRSLQIAPAMTLFTRMCRCASSSASERIMPPSAAFDVE